MIQDLGVTFGRANAINQQPRASVNLADWKNVRIWKNSETCIGNLSGSITGTLEDPDISEDGRAFLAKLLNQLSDAQLRDMFTVARVDLRRRDPAGGQPGLATVDEWVDAFKDKRQEVAGRRCLEPRARP
jgi:hypothetical protein